MTMHHGPCHWSCALYQIMVRMLMQKRPLFIISVSGIFKRQRLVPHQRIYSSHIFITNVH